MNNPYITKKTTRPRPWQGAILGICGFFTIVLGSMVPDYVTTKGAMDNGVLSALLLGCVTPILSKIIFTKYMKFKKTALPFD